MNLEEFKPMMLYKGMGKIYCISNKTNNKDKYRYGQKN